LPAVEYFVLSQAVKVYIAYHNSDVRQALWSRVFVRSFMTLCDVTNTSSLIFMKIGTYVQHLCHISLLTFHLERNCVQCSVLVKYGLSRLTNGVASASVHVIPPTSACDTNQDVPLQGSKKPTNTTTYEWHICCSNLTYRNRNGEVYNTTSQRCGLIDVQSVGVVTEEIFVWTVGATAQCELL